MSLKRLPLSIDVRFSKNGEMYPKRILYNDTSFEISKILEKRKIYRVASFAPVEYTVIVDGKRKKIYFEQESNSWFAVLGDN